MDNERAGHHGTTTQFLPSQAESWVLFGNSPQIRPCLLVPSIPPGPRDGTQRPENLRQLRRENLDTSVTRQSQNVTQTRDGTMTQTSTGTGTDACLDEQYCTCYERPVHNLAAASDF